MIHIRRATAEDVEPIVAMLADDHLGKDRESLDNLDAYARAFEAVDADPNQILAVAEDAGELVGTVQLTFVRGMARQGATSVLVNEVRVRSDRRGGGLGTELVTWVIEEGRRRGCALVQLTSHASRVDAHRFYRRLGFAQSHLGFKLTL